MAGSRSRTASQSDGGQGGRRRRQDAGRVLWIASAWLPPRNVAVAQVPRVNGLLTIAA
jgi:hypothetical protein